MPRQKKSDEGSYKKKSKKVVDDDFEEMEDEIIEDESPKKSRKTKDKKTKKSRKSNDTDEDDLSDIDVDDENDHGENDEVVSGGAPRRPVPRKEINPDTPIGDLKTEDILSYLINVGTDTLNPQLKFGSINLLNQLTGRRRRPPTYGSNRGNFNRGGGGGGYMSRGRGRPQPMKGSRPSQNPNDNLYGENDE